ncbi:MAG: hypothetical protein U0930_05030 [Pirellulales bacterium]
MIEQIEWIKTEEESPDSDIIVLMLKPESDNEPVWPGYLDDTQWRFADGSLTSPPIAWAEMPSGNPDPKLERLKKIAELAKLLLDEIELDEFGFTASSIIRGLRELI